MAMYESLLLAEEDDLMTSDIRSEIKGTA